MFDATIPCNAPITPELWLLLICIITDQIDANIIHVYVKAPMNPTSVQTIYACYIILPKSYQLLPGEWPTVQFSGSLMATRVCLRIA